MKEGNGITGLWVPGEEAREWWKPDKNGIWLKSSQAPSSGQPAGYAFSAFACHSYPLWISSDDPEIIEQIVPMELEQLGAISSADPSTHRSVRTIDHDGTRTLVQAMVIPPALEEDAKNPRWLRFFPAPCLFAFPRHRIVIWKEMGRFVVAFTREGRLIHFHSFGKGAFSEDLVAEIACIYGELYGRDVVDEVSVLLAWTEEAATPEARVIVDRALQIPVEYSEKPPPDPAIAAAIDVVPEAVLIARQKQKQRSTLMRAAAVAMSVLVVAAGLAALSLYRTDQQNQAMREKIARLKPAAESVRVARERWEAIEPAVSVDRHPVEIFYRIASLLPPKGIQVISFEMSENEIKFSGEASSMATAIKLKADLENSEDLADYEWRQPIPQKTPSGTAKFSATGIYRFATGYEG